MIAKHGRKHILELVHVEVNCGHESKAVSSQRLNFSCSQRPYLAEGSVDVMVTFSMEKKQVPEKLDREVQHK